MMARGMTDNGANLDKMKEESIHWIVGYVNVVLLETLTEFRQSESLA